MRTRAIVAVATAAVLAAVPAAACQKNHLHRRFERARPTAWEQVLTAGVRWPVVVARTKARPSRVRHVDLSAYKGVAAWVDIFDPGPWDHPARMVRRLAKRDVEAIFVQTSTYGRARPLLHEHELSTMLKVAHHRDMKVVAWYVPSFAKMDVDLRRSMDAVRFRSETGERFDGFALDIESTVVGNIARRNERLLRLSDKVRRRVGNSYALGAITPDPQASLYWPSFPWKAVGRKYDVIVPMGYFSFFTHGYKEVRRYMQRDITHIREETGNPEVAIHVIGGIADDAKPREVRGFVHATKKRSVLGASLYDSPITSPESWRIMRSFNGRAPVPSVKAVPKDRPANAKHSKKNVKKAKKESRKKL
jgi:hypothetical protein